MRDKPTIKTKVDVKSVSAGKPLGMLVWRNDNRGNSCHMVRERGRREREMRGDEEVERHN